MAARYVEPSTVAELITGPMKDETAVVDVRDDVRATDGLIAGHPVAAFQSAESADSDQHNMHCSTINP